MTLEEIQEKITLAKNEFRNENYHSSNALAQEVLSSITLTESTDVEVIEQYVEALYIEGSNSLVFGNRELTLHKCLEALQLAEKYNFTVQISNLYSTLGINYAILNQPENALECYGKALHIYEEADDKRNIGGTAVNIGIVYKELCIYEKAIEYFKKGLMIVEEIGHKQFQANATTNIGKVYISLQDNDKALEYFEKSRNIYEEIGNKGGKASAIMNIGIILLNVDEIEKAIDNFTNALLIFEELGNSQFIANCYGNIGNAYLQSSNFAKAIEYYEKALLISEDTKDNIIQSMVYLKIGRVYATKESEYFNVKKAEEFLLKSLQLAEGFGMKVHLVEVYALLHSLKLNEEQYKEALEYQTKSITLEKEIQSTEAKKQAEQFDIERKISEREKQNSIERAEAATVKTILHNILPVNIASRIINKERFIVDHFQSVSVLFLDLVGFTVLSSIAPPKQLVYLLDTIFTKADEIVESFGLEKIKTIGDGYLAVANVTTPLEEHQKATAQAALQLLETMKDFTVNIPSELGETDWINDMKDLEIRIGIHSGEVVAGIIGKYKYTYYLWGDAVNVASRMESRSEPGRIHISEAFAKSIEAFPEFSIIPRGEITIKGKGTMNTYWLEKEK